MKVRISIFLLIVISLCITGCTMQKDIAPVENKEAKADIAYYDTSTGTIYTTLSDNVDIKVCHWIIFDDEDSDYERVLLDILIKNKSETKLKKFKCIIKFNREAADLFCTGLTEYNIFQPVDLIPIETANGAGYSVNFAVQKDELLKEIGADKDNLLQEVRHITLELTWRGGSETIELHLDDLNKDS